jgi:uncharacterized protein YdaT
MSKPSQSALETAPRVHVIARQGKWAVKKEGNQRASRIFADRDAAVQAAKRLAGTAMDVVVHRKDGTILKWVVRDAAG